MKGKKVLIRAVALALALILCLGVLSVAAFAQETGKVNRLRQGENLSQEEGEREDLTFWHQYSIKRKWVEKIVFQDNLKGMPKNVLDFSEKWDKNDKQVVGWYKDHVLYVAAEGKITLPKDSSWLFASFTNLEELDFNNSVDTSQVENMSHMFADCVSLEKLDLSCFDTGAVKTMNAMFYRCKALEELNVGSFQTGNVKNMCRMFAYCENLEALDVSGFDTSSVTDLSFQFYCCKSLEKLDVSGFDTGKCMYLNAMFYHCEKLETLDVSGFDTSRVLGMCYTFRGCGNLKSVNPEGFDTSRVLQYKDFMDQGGLVNGKPWKELFA